MELSYDAFSKEYRVTLIGALSHTVSLGTDIFGNITRLDNALESMDTKLKECNEQLAVVKTQLATAKEQVKGSFPREQELVEKTARLATLTVDLKFNEKDKEILDGAPDDGDMEPIQKVQGHER